MISPAARSARAVAVVNVITGPHRLETWITDAFSATLSTLDTADGLKRFDLVRVSATDRAVLASITVWDDIAAFERWRLSPSFAAAHPHRGEHAAKFAELRAERLEFPVRTRRYGHDLTTEQIIAQVRTAHPDLVPSRGQLVHELHWPDSGRASPPRASWILLIACSATFLALLDATVVNLAFTALAMRFPAAGPNLAWVISGFATAFAAVLTVAGRWADSIGHRRVLVAGVLGFAVTSLGCALAPNAGVLIAARVAQGVAAALMLSPALGAVLASVPPDRAGAGIRAWAAAGALAAALGPAVGAAAVTWWGWQAIFLLNLPVCAILIPLSVIALPPDTRHQRGRPDLVGALLWSGGVAMLVATLTEGHSWGTASAATATMALTVAGLLGCAAACWRGATHTRPGLPVRLWRRSTPFAISGAVQAALGVVMGVVLLAIPVFLQQVWRQSLLHTAGCIGVIGVAAMLSAPICGRGVPARRPGWLCAAGMALIAAACAVCTSEHFSATTDLPLWWPLAIAFGVGVGATVTGLAIITAATVPEADISAGLGMGLTLRQTGSALGVAIVAAVVAPGPQYIPSIHRLFAITSVVVLLGALAAVAIQLPAHRPARRSVRTAPGTPVQQTGEPL
ncbi:MFS transporter [Nocardia sp. NEAU-G5]|uniref:MFS transporter n=1 Tax=Nocardia albiluteola TaxID=2842303 RepID=A0ABS6B1E7_9NOCA|nr:MFS transporter [Nocardia albiluteola]MBU3063100.1 MFS transporter [Nocardia albiluteola]